MWELAKTPSRGGNSVRSILTIVLTAVIAAFLWVVLASPLVKAADDTFSWVGDNLNYQGNGYTYAGKATKGNSAGIPTGADYYTHAQPVSSSASVPQTDIIYFAAGKTPKTEKSATFVTYNTNPSNSPPTYSKPHNKKTIKADDKTLQNSDGGSSCAIQGIGWIVCPVSNALAGAMDWLVGVLSGFVQVPPLNVTDTKNDLYVAWNIMRSFANVAFIIVFLIIIYSQLTNFGVSNYGLKKLLPRLIVAAVVVNMSYFICAIILDASNIIGNGIQNILIDARTTIFNATGPNASTHTDDFTSITTAALAGGTLAAGATIGGVAVNTALIGGEMAGLWYLIVPALVGLILAVLLVIIILAVRQALIIILIVVSPLAFVAYLLPNTEKWFKSWQKTFTTMMVFYPAFSAVFAGAQLASAVIIKNAPSLTVAVLGLIVQVAPLAITPWLLRISGSAIQSVAKVVQGLNKRVVGATSTWAKPRREVARLRGLSATNTSNPFKRNAQYWSGRGRAVKDRAAAYEIGAENNYRRTRRYAAIDNQRRQFEKGKAILDKQYDRDWKSFEKTSAYATEQDIRLRALTNEDTLLGKELDNRFDEVSATGKYAYQRGQLRTPELRRLARDVQQTRRLLGAEATRGANAKIVQDTDYAEAIKASSALQKRAQGVNTKHDAGANLALANAVQTIDKAGADNLSAADTVVSSYQFDDRQFGTLAETGTATNDKGETLTGALFQQSAFNTLTKIGIAGPISKILQNAYTMDDEMRESFKGAIDRNSSTVKSKIMWAADGDIKKKILNGTAITQTDIDAFFTKQFTDGKVNRELLSTQDASVLKDIYDGIVRGTIPQAEVQVLAKQIMGDPTATPPIEPNKGLIDKMNQAAIDQMAAIANLP